MRYSALAPGKRMRPFLVTECCLLAGGSAEAALPASMAVECIHAFSLVHDDLPAMDDAELRRGRPTNHVKFGEATAILAGDALLALPFEILADVSPPERAIALVRELASASGWTGMIGGQMADLEGESHPADRRLVEAIHERKTVRLIEASCRMGVIAAGGGSQDRETLGAYGRHLGRAFQIVDDLLDATGTPAGTGKDVGRDQAAGKQTFPAGVGLEESRVAAREAANRAISAVRGYGEAGRSLCDLADFVVTRC